MALPISHAEPFTIAAVAVAQNTQAQATIPILPPYGHKALNQFDISSGCARQKKGSDCSPHTSKRTKSDGICVRNKNRCGNKWLVLVSGATRRSKSLTLSTQAAMARMHWASSCYATCAQRRLCKIVFRREGDCTNGILGFNYEIAGPPTSSSGTHA
jgi:hypothetical protein